MIDGVELLFERQMRAWPLLAKGVAGLAQARTRPVRIDWFDVFVRCIPHRMASTMAAVDGESIAKRPCFLCAANLPAEEEGVAFNEEFTIYCNPFPIIDRHLTIAHRDHVPQRIERRFGHMLDLAAALPGHFVIYNGPECGASAPDHMHFQAGSRRLFPIERDLAAVRDGGIQDYARNVFVFRSRDRARLIRRLDRAIDLLADEIGRRSEPLINVAAFQERGEWTAFLFPRAKHRPQAFYTGELTVSPAAVDLCGIMVTPLAQDFERISADAIASIFWEVTLANDLYGRVAERLESEA